MKEGILSMFKGLGTSILSVANAIVYFQIYEQLKYRLFKKIDGTPSVLNIFLSSTISKGKFNLKYSNSINFNISYSCDENCNVRLSRIIESSHLDSH